jgi:hypothetical protein
MSVLIEAGQKNSVKADEVAERISERDARQSNDTRTPAQVLLNEPEPSRSALSGIVKVQHSLFVSVRTKLGRSRTTPHYNPSAWKFTLNR